MIPKGEFVPFLGRIFLDPWSTSNSIQDPQRTLPKIHLTCSEDTIPLEVAAVNKAMGYKVNDEHTPIIGAFCNMIFLRYSNVTISELI